MIIKGCSEQNRLVSSDLRDFVRYIAKQRLVDLEPSPNSAYGVDTNPYVDNVDNGDWNSQFAWFDDNEGPWVQARKRGVEKEGQKQSPVLYLPRVRSHLQRLSDE